MLEQSLRLYHFMHGLACGLAVSCGTTYNTNLGLRPNCQHTFRPDILPSNKKLLSDISPKTDVFPKIATQAGSDVKKHSTFRTPHPSASLQRCRSQSRNKEISKRTLIDTKPAVTIPLSRMFPIFICDLSLIAGIEKQVFQKIVR